jgi:hypothetical protein
MSSFTDWPMAAAQDFSNKLIDILDRSKCFDRPEAEDCFANEFKLFPKNNRTVRLVTSAATRLG